MVCIKEEQASHKKKNQWNWIEMRVSAARWDRNHAVYLLLPHSHTKHCSRAVYIDGRLGELCMNEWATLTDLLKYCRFEHLELLVEPVQLKICRQVLNVSISPNIFHHLFIYSFIHSLLQNIIYDNDCPSVTRQWPCDQMLCSFSFP